ncbi:hypothetical protein ACC846_38535, partial [Rhizobium ruizarguesonis]
IVVMPAALPKVAITLAEKIRMEVESLAIAHDERPYDMSIVTVSIGVAFTREKVVESEVGFTDYSFNFLSNFLAFTREKVG